MPGMRAMHARSTPRAVACRSCRSADTRRFARALAGATGCVSSISAPPQSP
jgi:formate-dependent nitrite reductase cytochrome c552 subunit